MGRYLDQSGGRDPLFAMSLGPTLPKLLQGNKSAGSAIPSGTLSLPHASQLETPFTAVESPFPARRSWPPGSRSQVVIC